MRLSADSMLDPHLWRCVNTATGEQIPAAWVDDDAHSYGTWVIRPGYRPYTHAHSAKRVQIDQARKVVEITTIQEETTS